MKLRRHGADHQRIYLVSGIYNSGKREQTAAKVGDVLKHLKCPRPQSLPRWSPFASSTARSRSSLPAPSNGITGCKYARSSQLRAQCADLAASQSGRCSAHAIWFHRWTSLSPPAGRDNCWRQDFKSCSGRFNTASGASISTFSHASYSAPHVSCMGRIVSCVAPSPPRLPTGSFLLT